ncbi:MAG: arsenate reductase ArsC [Lachnospirales bacterium]
MLKPKVGFICVHNSCRSQMAEALGRLYANDVFESYSAGTEVVPQISQEAVKTINELYGYDMSGRYSKLVKDLPELDIIITMGCNVNCPYVKCSYREDWRLEDPNGKEHKDFVDAAKLIENKILDLKQRIENNTIKI